MSRRSEARARRRRRKAKRALRNSLFAAAAIGLVVAGFVVFSIGGGERPASLPPGVLADVTVRRDVAGERLPTSFLGFSQEFQQAIVQEGPKGFGTNPVLVGLFDNITRTGSGAPAWRIGGASTDQSYYSRTGGGRPRGASYTVTPDWLAGLRSFLARTGAPAILGVNLGLDDPRQATTWIRAARAALPRRPPPVFELGNEPDSYDVNTLPGSGGPGQADATIRPAPYRLKSYLADLGQFGRAIARVKPKPFLAGPAFACRFDCLKSLPRILSERQFDLASLHRYALTVCGGDGTPATVANLLAADKTRKALQGMSLLARDAREAGVPLRLTETNSVGCGGKNGVSNVFASALWSADWSFSLEARGLSGVDFHGGSPLYAAFRTRYVRGTYYGAVQPLYYGLLLFAEATAHRARPLFVALGLGRRRIGPNLKAWAFSDATAGVVRVALINKDLVKGGPVRVRIPGGAAVASLKRLRAPSVTSKGGVTWGGRSIPLATRDGRLVGRAKSERVRRRSGDVFTVDVPRASAALLTVRVSPAS